MGTQEYLQEIATLLHRFADLQLEFAELCEQQAYEALVDLVTK